MRYTQTLEASDHKKSWGKGRFSSAGLTWKRLVHQSWENISASVPATKMGEWKWRDARDQRERNTCWVKFIQVCRLDMLANTPVCFEDLWRCSKKSLPFENLSSEFELLRKILEISPEIRELFPPSVRCRYRDWSTDEAQWILVSHCHALQVVSWRFSTDIEALYFFRCW